MQPDTEGLQARQRRRVIGVGGQPGGEHLKGAATVVSFVTLFLVVRRITRWPRHVTSRAVTHSLAAGIRVKTQAKELSI